jgi:hypothetical protein
MSMYRKERYFIPEDAFEQRDWPDGIINEPPATIKVLEDTEHARTVRERKRRDCHADLTDNRIMWPKLFSKEVIEFTRKESVEVFLATDPSTTMRSIIRRKCPDSDAGWFHSGPA